MIVLYLAPLFCMVCLMSTSSERILEEDYDSNGCCLSCGEFYCAQSKECVSDWDSCVLGKFDSNECTFTYNATDKGHQFSYDVSSYENSFYKISDAVTHTGQVYDYYFSLCKKVTPSLLPSVCNSTSGSAYETCDAPAMAYQYFSTSWDYEACYRLSNCFDDGPEVTMGLLDPVEPASGVYIKYSGGNTCPNSYSDKEECTVHRGDDDEGMSMYADTNKLETNKQSILNPDIKNLPKK